MAEVPNFLKMGPDEPEALLILEGKVDAVCKEIDEYGITLAQEYYSNWLWEAPADRTPYKTLGEWHQKATNGAPDINTELRSIADTQLTAAARKLYPVATDERIAKAVQKFLDDSDFNETWQAVDITNEEVVGPNEGGK